MADVLNNAFCRFIDCGLSIDQAMTVVDYAKFIARDQGLTVDELSTALELAEDKIAGDTGMQGDELTDVLHEAVHHVLVAA